MTYDYGQLERGVLTVGGPGGILLAGIVVPIDEISYFDFIVMGRNTNASSFACHIQSAWDSDSAGVLQRLGPDIIDAFRGIGAIDWGACLEEDGNGTLRFRSYGSADTGYDCRWNFTGHVYRIGGPLAFPSSYEG